MLLGEIIRSFVIVLKSTFYFFDQILFSQKLFNKIVLCSFTVTICFEVIRKVACISIVCVLPVITFPHTYTWCRVFTGLKSICLRLWCEYRWTYECMVIKIGLNFSAPKSPTQTEITKCETLKKHVVCYKHIAHYALICTPEIIYLESSYRDMRKNMRSYYASS